MPGPGEGPFDGLHRRVPAAEGRLPGGLAGKAVDHAEKGPKSVPVLEGVHFGVLPCLELAEIFSSHRSPFGSQCADTPARSTRSKRQIGCELAQLSGSALENSTLRAGDLHWTKKCGISWVGRLPSKQNESKRTESLMGPTPKLDGNNANQPDVQPTTIHVIM